MSRAREVSAHELIPGLPADCPDDLAQEMQALTDRHNAGEQVPAFVGRYIGANGRPVRLIFMADKLPDDLDGWGA